jgi:asparagine synthase (glutamine-hydrolysing)
MIARNKIEIAPGTLGVMKSALGHRGPDDSGEVVRRLPDWTVGLAHTRLAILDLSSAGHQPMASGQHPIWLTYNGEVYNFRELRGELMAADRSLTVAARKEPPGPNRQLPSRDREGAVAPFVSTSDTEVVLRAYEQWGVAALPRLRGMFALGVWDEPAQVLTLGRDPLGIKPLYYYQTGDVFLFASELRALLETGLVPRRASFEGLVSYLEYGSVQGPLTIIEGIRSLPPGHSLQIKICGDRLQITEASFSDALYREDSTPAFPDRREAVVVLHEKLKESVQLHLVSDVPVGIFLSGGIDSASLIALMAQVSDRRPKAYSVIFEEREFSEADQAQYVARKFDADHHEIFLTDKALFELLPSAFQAMDQPTLDGINTFVISKTVREAGIKVAMSGLGGDELFAGYPSFRRARQLKQLSIFPRPFRHAVSNGGRNLWNHSVATRKFWDMLESDGTSRAAYDISRRVFSRSEIATMLPAATHLAPTAYHQNGGDPVNAVSRYEMQGYMTNTLLRDTDFMSMAHSLEVRVPFLDPEIVRFVMQVPGRWKLDGSRPKPLLLDALNGAIPERVWKRRKMGFTLPFERWMQSTLKPDLELALNSDSLFRTLGLRSEFVAAVWNSFTHSRRAERWARPWALFVLKKWCDLNRVEIR